MFGVIFSVARCVRAASLQLLRNLDQQARQEGGAVYMINGNHESLNVAGDFRCAMDGMQPATICA